MILKMNDLIGLNNDGRMDLKSEYLYGSLYKDFLRDYEYLSRFSKNCQSILRNYNNFIDAITFNNSKNYVIFCQETWHSFILILMALSISTKQGPIQEGVG